MEDLPQIIASKLGLARGDIKDWEVRSKSVDSRKKPHIQFVYTVDFITDKKLRLKKNRDLSAVDEAAEAASQRAPEPGIRTLDHRPVVVGMGPAGLFAAL